MAAAGADPTAKRAILAAIVEALRADLDRMTASQQDAQASAVHEEARPENDKDTRATESSYLARGLAKRVADLRAELATLTTMTLPRLGAGDPVCVGALVVLEREDGAEVRYLVLPCAGGRRVVHGGSTVTAVSPGSPLGRSLLGKGVDDEVIARTPRGRTALVVVDLA